MIGLRAVDAGVRVELLQLVGRLEGAVGRIDRAAPRHVQRAGNVAGADRQLLRAGRREDLAAELVGRADVDDGGVRLLVRPRRARRRAARAAWCWRPASVMLLGFTASTRLSTARFSSSHFLRPPSSSLTFVEAVDVEDPGAPGGEPVVVVAVEDDRGVLVDAELAQQRLEFLLRGDVALHRVDQVGVPDDVLRARNVAALEQARLDADLDDADLRVGEVLLQPVGGDERVLAGARACGQKRNREGEGAGPDGLLDHSVAPSVQIQMFRHATAGTGNADGFAIVMGG